MSEAAGEERCEDVPPTAADAPQTEFAVWQAKDEGRVFFRFFQDEPPNVYLMYDPEARNVGAFAHANGFRGGRDLGAGWSVAGSLQDDAAVDAMWIDDLDR